jgi:outer membrane lipoprotein-sorting protein
LQDFSPLTSYHYKPPIFISVMAKSIVLLAFTTATFAQGYRPAMPEQQKELTQKIATASERMKTLRCDFVQKKTISILADEMVSEGKLFFKQADKLSWEYLKPYQYRFTLNGDKVMINSGETKNIIDVNSSKIFKDISKIIISGINGTGIFEEDRFTAKINVGTQDFQVVLTPKQKELKQLFKGITLTFNKTDYTVNTVEIREQSDDVTLITMTNKQINKELDDEIFDIR